MWIMVPCLRLLVEQLCPVFSEPSFVTHCELLLGWVMCLGTHTQYRVAQSFHADEETSRAERHPFDRFYNFFARSAWIGRRSWPGGRIPPVAFGVKRSAVATWLDGHACEPVALEVVVVELNV